MCVPCTQYQAKCYKELTEKQKMSAVVLQTQSQSSPSDEAGRAQVLFYFSFCGFRAMIFRFAIGKKNHLVFFPTTNINYLVTFFCYILSFTYTPLLSYIQSMRTLKKCSTIGGRIYSLSHFLSVQFKGIE